MSNRRKLGWERATKGANRCCHPSVVHHNNCIFRCEACDTALGACEESGAVRWFGEEYALVG